MTYIENCHFQPSVIKLCKSERHRYSTNYPALPQTVTLLMCYREVAGLSLGQDTNFLNIFYGFPQFIKTLPKRRLKAGHGRILSQRLPLNSSVVRH
jgi:hypothetical protein